MSTSAKPNWGLHKINQLGFVGRGRSRHRPRNEPSLYDGNYPFFQTGDIKSANLYLRQYTQTYNEKGLAQSKLWEPETLCITIAANIAETAILGIQACFPDSVIGFVADNEKADVRFIKYSIDYMKLKMQRVSHGTTQDNLSLEKLTSFDFPTPSLPTQRKIATILSAYDDLIENNLRRIRILEEMAQALYREWFVKFRFPGHEKVRIVDSPLGKIPEGWDVIKLGERVELLYGKGLRKADRKEGDVPVFGSSGVVGHHNQSIVHGPGIIVGRKGNVGSVFWSDTDFYPIDTVFYTKTDLPMHYVYYDLRHQNFINNDAAVPGLNRNQAHSLPLIVPEKRLMDKFTESADLTFRQITNLNKRAITLRQTRDLLLPKLISGDLDVSELEINISEEAA